jgi:protein-S-isoprenylcysteine O-methyltransferase Ste14
MSPAAVASLALFGVAGVYWAYRYFWAFGLLAPLDATPVATAAVRDIALFVGFAVHHSVFARTRFKAWVEGHWPGHERPIYVSVASLLLIGVCAAWHPLPGTAWQTSAPPWPILRLVQLAAGCWVIAAARVLGLAELAGLRPGPPGPTVFKAAGPYSWVRHPLYTGWMVLVFTVPTMSMTQLLFALCGAAYVLVGLELEERTLRRGPSGVAYRRYARQVPHKLVPHLY